MVYEPIQMIWVGNSISRLEHLCMQSFISNGHPLHLYTYGAVKNIPNDVQCFDANRIIPQEQIFLHKNSYAVFADLFRWQLLAQQGGYYSDTDVLCIKPFQFDDEVVIGKEASNRVNNAVLKFPAQHPIVLEMLDSALHPNKIKPYDTKRLKRKKIIKKLTFNHQQIGWGENAGPSALSRVLHYMQNEVNVKPKDFSYFYPISADNFDALFDSSLGQDSLFHNTHAVHLWNEMIRRANIDKNAPFNLHSFVGQCFSQYCPNYKEEK